ncbi:RpiB/LacA/LacB family sugar-phosphate isomerase [Alphaproteobacteria bacterium]|nr:RpiB/LacA/LacB family sugar-phosphate isomerase [Alphaproteobacteria bacterium]
MANNIVLLASDHNGVEQKEAVKAYLETLGCIAIDLGPFTAESSVDYNTHAEMLAQPISSGDVPRGILICGTGVGMSIVANRFSHVRAVLAHNYMAAEKSREHNDSNVLCLGA